MTIENLPRCSDGQHCSVTAAPFPSYGSTQLGFRCLVSIFREVVALVAMAYLWTPVYPAWVTSIIHGSGA
eukprot:7729146-Pyramimonas_sp.AAC.1